MYGLPRDIDLTFFRSRTLLQVCFGAHDLILNFDGDVSLCVTSSIGCMVSDGHIQQYHDFCEAARVVGALLNQTVLAVESDEAGTLTLKFNNGGMLAIYDDSKDYESYTIKHGSQRIIV